MSLTLYFTQNNLLDLLKHDLSRRQLKLEFEADIQLNTSHASDRNFCNCLYDFGLADQSSTCDALFSFVNSN